MYVIVELHFTKSPPLRDFKIQLSRFCTFPHTLPVVLQEYQAHVYDEYVIHGNTAVFRCQVPDFMKEFLIVTSWTRDDGLVIVHHKNA
ncbi:uncharacterized protein TNCT_3681, partial [Trichonephila clavata]